MKNSPWQSLNINSLIILKRVPWEPRGWASKKFGGFRDGFLENLVLKLKNKGWVSRIWQAKESEKMDREEDQVYKQKKQHGNKNNDTSPLLLEVLIY